MATLDELLALLPDNDTGAIDAADLREVITGVWNEGATAGAALHAELAALADYVQTIQPGGGDTRTVTGIWQINPQNGAPGSRQMSADEGGFATTPALNFYKLDQSNTDFTLPLMSATSLVGQQQSDSTHWIRWVVNGDALDMGAYVQVPVVVDSSSPVLSDAALWQNAVVALNYEPVVV